MAAAKEVAEAAPAQSRPKSMRRSEIRSLRSTAGGGGRERAALLDAVSIECAAAIAQTHLLLEGICDLLRCAVSRDGALHMSATAVLVRSALEISGQTMWLLDLTIDGTERVRRYLTWRFDDLKQMRYLMQSTSGDDATDIAASGFADNVEQQLVRSVTACGWGARPQRVKPKSLEPACLLDGDGRAVKLPGMGEFAMIAAMSRDAYKILSLPAHGQRYGFHASFLREHVGGQARIFSSTIEPELLVRWTCMSVALPALCLARWNGLTEGRLMKLFSPLFGPLT